MSKITLDIGLNQQTLGHWERKAMRESKSKPMSKPDK